MEIILIILLMATVTHIPRIMPGFLLNYYKPRARIDAFLRAIPYAALSALIIPGILSVDPQNIHIGIIGGIVACILALFDLHTLIIVSGALLVVLFL